MLYRPYRPEPEPPPDRWGLILWVAIALILIESITIGWQIADLIRALPLH